MIEMSGEKHVLVFQFRVGPGQHPRDILRFHLRFLECDVAANRHFQREMRQCLIGIGGFQNFGDAVTGSLKELIGMLRIHGDCQSQPRRFIERRIGQRHGRHGMCKRLARPGNVHRFRIRNICDPHGARRFQVFPTLGGRLIMRFQRPGNRLRPAREIHHDLSFDIEPRQIVVMFLRNPEPISGKHGRRFR